MNIVFSFLTILATIFYFTPGLIASEYLGIKNTWSLILVMFLFWGIPFMCIFYGTRKLPGKKRVYIILVIEVLLMLLSWLYAWHKLSLLGKVLSDF